MLGYTVGSECLGLFHRSDLLRKEQRSAVTTGGPMYFFFLVISLVHSRERQKMITAHYGLPHSAAAEANSAYFVILQAGTFSFNTWSLAINSVPGQ